MRVKPSDLQMFTKYYTPVQVVFILLVQTSIDHISADDGMVISVMLYTWSMTYDYKALFPTAIHRNLFQIKECATNYDGL